MAKSRNNIPSVFDDDNKPKVENLSNDEEMKEETPPNETPPVENTLFEEATTIPTPPSDEHSMGQNYNPLEGEVKKRDYAQSFGAGQDVQIVDRVPEPNITNLPPPPPPTKGSDSAFITGDAPQNGQGGGQTTSPQGNTQPPPQQEKLNPDMAGLSEKDAKQAASLLVDAVLGGYKQVWGLTAEWVKVSDDQILQWVMQDQISLDISININAKGQEATLRDVYNQFNAQADQALTVDLTEESFVKVRQAMIREFTKRGWGISDMQFIIQHFVRDAGQRALAVYQLKSVINGFTKSVMMSYEQTKKLREELLAQKSYVAPSQPTVQEPKKEQRPPAQTAPPITEPEPPNGSEFVESFVMPPSQTNADVKEVPFYENNSHTETTEIHSAIIPIEENKE